MSANVVERLKQQLRRAESMGLTIRMEMLGDQHATWCEIAGVPTLFVDVSQTAAEQLKQVEENLQSFAAVRSVSRQTRQTSNQQAA